ncbi:MAG: hypothetical protein WD176_09750, partial [Pirellulales bacterium]
GGCYATAFLPVLKCRAAIARAADERMSDESRVEALLAAAEDDPFSADPWVEMGRLSVGHLKRDPDSEFWGREFLRATTMIVSLRGNSSAMWREMGDWSRELYELRPSEVMAARVVQLRRGAAYLYPNSAVVQAEYALALEAGDNRTAARRAAARALELDRLTPHADKKLSPELKSQLEKLLDAAKSR